MLQAAAIADLVKTTQRELGELSWSSIASDLQDHVALRSLLTENRVQFQSGYEVQWNLMHTTSGAAKDVGLYASDSVNIGDVMVTASVPWRHINTSYAIERREIAMNREPRRIVDLVKIRRSDAMISLADHLEKRFWGKPASATDNEKLYGVGYWLGSGENNGTSCASITDGDGGFTGGDPFSAAGAGGLLANTYPRWENFNGAYAATETSANFDSLFDGTSGALTTSTLINAMRKAYVQCQFKPAPNAGVSDYNTGDKWGIYAAYDQVGFLEEYARRANDHLGLDVAPADGRVRFRGVPITYVPQLDGATGGPVAMLNWGVFRPVFLSGEYMREQGPDVAANQHTVFTTHVDCSMNIQCTDRRRNALIATGAVTWPS